MFICHNSNLEYNFWTILNKDIICRKWEGHSQCHYQYCGNRTWSLSGAVSLRSKCSQTELFNSDWWFLSQTELRQDITCVNICQKFFDISMTYYADEHISGNKLGCNDINVFGSIIWDSIAGILNWSIVNLLCHTQESNSWNLRQ